MINQFYNQYEDPNIVNSYLDLNVQSDFHYNDELQTNIITNNENLGSVDKIYGLDNTNSSRNYPRIIENKECKINMTILPKRMDLTDSCNKSILDNSLKFSDINVTDVENSINFNTSLIDNSKKITHEILAENKFLSTSVCENTELDNTLVTFCDLMEFNNLSTVNNNDKLYYNPQIANVSQHTGMYIYNKYI